MHKWNRVQLFEQQRTDSVGVWHQSLHQACPQFHKLLAYHLHEHQALFQMARTVSTSVKAQ